MDARLEESQLASLLESAKLLGGSLDLDKLLKHLLRTVMGRLLVMRALIAIQSQGRLVVELSRGIPLAQKGQVFDEPKARDWGLRLFFPIGDPSAPLGVLGLAQPASGSLDPTEEEFLQALLGLAASSIQNARAHDQVVRSNRTLDQKIQELHALLDLGRGLASTVDPEQVAQLLMLTLAGRWAVLRQAILTWKEGQPAIERVRNIDIPDSSKLRDLADPWAPGESVGLTPGSVVFPIRSGESTTGVVICGPRPGNQIYCDADLEFGTGLVAQGSVALDNAWHFRDTLYREQLEKELAVAASIQKDLFPQQMPVLPHTEIGGRNRQAREVGGDYYDVLPVGEPGPEHPHVLCVADISGKGISASLLMANIQATLRALLDDRRPLAAMVRRVNDLLYASTPGNKYATAFFLRYDPLSGECEYVNGGHNDAIVLRANGSVELLAATGMPVGLLPKRDFDSARVRIETGDLVMLYSDGVPEAWNHQQEEGEFGMDRIVDCLKATAALPCEAILDHLFRSIDAFVADEPQHDDITMLVLKRMHPATAK
jgi:phosphoserine phosphatase RsbU/P